jgi:predicted permease
MKSVFRRLGWLARPRSRDAELEEELQFHLEEEAGECRAAGMSRDAARMAARRELGNLTLLQEEARQLWTWTFWERLKQDLRSGIRLTCAHPGFTAVAVISLAVGIGVNTAMFSMTDAILFHPLPVDRPQEVVRLLSVAQGDESGAFSYPDLKDFQFYQQSLTSLTGFAHTLVGIRPQPSATAQVKLGAMVVWNFFDVLGVKPQIGRGFREDEDRQPVCVLSNALWRSHFGADPTVAGRTIRLSNLDFTVIGIAPASFTGLGQFVHEEIYLPLGMWPQMSVDGDTPIQHRQSRDLNAYGRLRPGRTVAQARSEFAAIASNLERTHPKADAGRKAVVMTEVDARRHLDPTLAPLAMLLLGIAGLVLLIACANVANLLLSRASARSREVAIRLAIGAGKGRLLRQFMTESMLLAALGGVAGLGMAAATMSYLSSLRMPTQLPLGLVVPLDLRVLAFCAAVSVLSGLVFGLAPAWQMVKTDLTGTMKSGELAMGQSKRRFPARNLLVTGQVTVSTLLLILAGLFVKDLLQAMKANPGFRTDHMLLMALDPAAVRYNEAQTRQFYKELVGRVRTLPGVRGAALAQNVPLGFAHNSRLITVEGYQMQRDQQGIGVALNTIDENYLPALDIPMVAGRNFDAHDTAAAPPVVIVNQTMAQRYWPTRSPVGGRIQINGNTVEVVGVARDMKYNDVSEAPMPFLFLPYAQNFTPTMTLHVQTAGDPASMAGPVGAEVRRMDPEQPVMEVNTMDRFFRDGALFGNRLIAQLVTAVGVFGSILAAIGLYGVIAYSVSRRTREIGIRVAIGAEHADVLRVFLRQGAVFTAIGIGLGLTLALALAPIVGSQLVDHNPRDPVVFVVVSAMLAAVSMLASFVPARRAARIDPLSALRHE